MGTDIGAVHDRLVGPFEIERVAERLADARVLEFIAAGVEEPALRARRRIVRKQFALDATISYGREIVTRVPDSRGEFFAKQVTVAGETFEGDVAVAVKIKTDRIEIGAAAIDGKLCAPPTFDPLELDEAIDLEFRHLVRPAPERNVERRFIERTLGIIGLRKDRQTC